MRRRIAVAVVLFHVLLLWLLVAGFRTRLDPPTEQPQFVSLWIDPPALEDLPTPAQTQPQPRAQPSRAAPRTDTPQRQPAIEPQLTAPLTTPLTTPMEPVPESTAPAVVTAPLVDWDKASDLAARRMGEELGAPKATPFSEEPKSIPKPCKPKERSMEWKGGANPGVHWAGPFPILVTKRCSITIGFFACNLGWIPPPNEHLLDDMKDPNRSRSSVPDPKVCD